MQCTKCLKEYPENYFHNRGNGKKHKQCKLCKREAINKHYKKNRIKMIARSKISNKKRKQSLYEFIHKIKNQPCKDCGIQYPYYVMQFDHTTNDKKSNVSDLIQQLASIKRIEDEIAKCEIVCANCHAIRTHNRKQQTLVN